MNQEKDYFRSYQVNVTKTGATQVSYPKEFLQTQYTIPKTSSNDQISAAFKEITEALNNPMLQDCSLNGNKENEILN